MELKKYLIMFELIGRRVYKFKELTKVYMCKECNKVYEVYWGVRGLSICKVCKVCIEV